MPETTAAAKRALRACRSWSILSEKHDVNVSPQPHVIGEVPAEVIRILINHDLVRNPEPVIAKAVVVRGNAEVEAAKPEALPVPSFKPKDMTGVRVPGLVAIIAVFHGGAPCTSNRSRPMRGNVPDALTLGMFTAPGLRKSRNGKDQQRHKKSNILFHVRLPPPNAANDAGSSKASARQSYS